MHRCILTHLTATLSLTCSTQTCTHSHKLAEVVSGHLGRPRPDCRQLMGGKAQGCLQQSKELASKFKDDDYCSVALGLHAEQAQVVNPHERAQECVGGAHGQGQQVAQAWIVLEGHLDAALLNDASKDLQPRAGTLSFCLGVLACIMLRAKLPRHCSIMYSDNEMKQTAPHPRDSRQLASCSALPHHTAISLVLQRFVPDSANWS